MQRIVLDTNVIVAGLQSRHGASNRLLGLVPERRFALLLSVPLFLEYEAVLKRPERLRYSSDRIVTLTTLRTMVL